MPKAVCPKCGAEGECDHWNDLEQGEAVTIFSFKCSKCNFGKTDKGGIEVEDPKTHVIIPLNHPANQCPYCGQFGSEEAKKAKERFHAKIKQGLEALAADPTIGKEIGEWLFARTLEDFDNLSPAMQQILIAKLKEKGLIS